VNRQGWRLVFLLAPVLLGAVAAPAQDDRLERFRTLAATRLALVGTDDGERSREALREIYALLDEEIVESLQSGSVFTSLPFLQERLDGFADAWGGASFKLRRLGPLTVGAFQLVDSSPGNSVRVYGEAGGEARLLHAFVRDGRPVLYPLAGGPAPLMVVAWEGWPTNAGVRPLRLEMLRMRGDDVTVIWDTAPLYPEGLVARDWRLRGNELRIRYELHYPGWTPGCEGQTEQEDVYRLPTDGTAPARVGRRQYNAWHQALHHSVSGLFAALASGDRASLTAFVPDAELRRRLPATLAAEPACDAPDPAADPDAVSVAAVESERRPWSLTWRRAGRRWQLVSATPVL